jgi:hypothetical protein
MPHLVIPRPLHDGQSVLKNSLIVDKNQDMLLGTDVNLAAIAKKPHSVLLIHQVIEIFKVKIANAQSENKEKISASSLSRKYGVSEKTIRDIWLGHTWNQETWHLDPTRPLIRKQTGRPKGSKDRVPRKFKDEALIRGCTVGKDQPAGFTSVGNNPESSCKDLSSERSSSIDGRTSSSRNLPPIAAAKITDIHDSHQLGSSGVETHRDISTRNDPTAVSGQPAAQQGVGLGGESVDDILHRWAQRPQQPPAVGDPFRSDWPLGPI